MLVGVPTEVKDSELRVAVTPDGVRELVGRGHRVLVETGAGEGSSISDAELRAAQEAGVALTGLGPRILRSRTVAVAVAAAVLSRTGDFA